MMDGCGLVKGIWGRVLWEGVKKRESELRLVGILWGPQILRC